MDISFQTRRLKRQMEDDKAMQRAFGTRARALRKRLRTLSQAPCLAAVPSEPPDRCHPLAGDRAGQFAVTLTGNWRLVFEPDHDPVPEHPDGSIDQNAVTAITIIEVVDYHGD